MTDPTTLLTLTIVEILALVLVLATYLVLIARHLRSISSTLAKVTFGVRAVDQQCANIGPSVLQINRVLQDIANVLPGLAGEAERLAAKR